MTRFPIAQYMHYRSCDVDDCEICYAFRKYKFKQKEAKK